MGKKRTGVMIYFEIRDMLELMSNDEIAAFFMAILNYAEYGEVPDFGKDKAMRMAWANMKHRIDHDAERYEKTCKARSDAARQSHGGRSEADNDEDQQQEEPEPAEDRAPEPEPEPSKTAEQEFNDMRQRRIEQLRSAYTDYESGNMTRDEAQTFCRHLTSNEKSMMRQIVGGTL